MKLEQLLSKFFSYFDVSELMCLLFLDVIVKSDFYS